MMPEDLSGYRHAIRERWEELILRTYPEGSARFFGKERDPFRNPVGATVRSATAVLLDGLLSGEESPESADAIERMVRMRSVQQFTPGAAVEFALLLKRAVMETLGEDRAREHQAWLIEFGSRVDRMVLRSVDAYVRCREQIHEIRTRDALARTYSLLRQAGALEVEDEAGKPPGAGRRPVRLKGGQPG
jgi:hypothetical protein